MHGVGNLVDGSAQHQILYNIIRKQVVCVLGKADFRKGRICHEGAILTQTSHTNNI